MNIDDFESSLGQAEPPAGLPPALVALWHVGKGDWDRAHGIVQADEDDPQNNWVHAHLHRVEGDLGNAGYWYRRAGQPRAEGDLKDEWRAIVRSMLG
jgi:hypothetical protein